MADVVYELIKGVPFISAKIFGKARSFTGRFIVDTGAAMTIVRTARVDALGFSAKDATKLFSTDSVIGREEGYRLVIPCIEVFNERIENIEIAALDLPPKYQIDGLIGMNLLNLFEFTFNPKNLSIKARRL
ncbi:MAG: retropepsin-like aspartic protease [Pseudomonadota bacterium]